MIKMLKQMAGLLKLMKACREGKLDEVKQLISQGVNPANNLNGWTPLLMAIRCGQAEIAQFFLGNYPDLKTKELTGFSGSFSFGNASGYSSLGDLARKYCPEILPSLGESKELSQNKTGLDSTSSLVCFALWNQARKSQRNASLDQNIENRIR